MVELPLDLRRGQSLDMQDSSVSNDKQSYDLQSISDDDSNSKPFIPDSKTINLHNKNKFITQVNIGTQTEEWEMDIRAKNYTLLMDWLSLDQDTPITLQDVLNRKDLSNFPAASNKVKKEET